MGGGTSKPTTNSNIQAVDTSSQLSPQYVITNGIIRLRGDGEKNPNEVQLIRPEYPKRGESETKESIGVIGITNSSNDVPIIEDIDDAGSVVGGMPP